MRPAATDVAPEANWGAQVPSAAELYERFDPDVAAATVAALTEIAGAEPAITAQVTAAAPAGCRMHGLEFRMKSPASLAGKIDKKASELPFPSPHDVAARLTDFVRYTVVAPRDADVATAAVSTLSTLQQQGWTLRELEHSFVDGNPYKGLHAIVRHGATGQDVEIQFHSERGIAVKDAHHVDYELMRDGAQPRPNRSAAFEKMAAAWSQVTTPAGLADLEISGVRVEVKIYRNSFRPS